MANTNTARPLYAPNYTGPRFFGAPIGDFSVFQTLLITVASGVASFFAATFISIVVLLIVSQFAHKMPDFSITYRWFGLPVGLTVLVVAGVYLGSLLARRIKNQGSGN